MGALKIFSYRTPKTLIPHKAIVKVMSTYQHEGAPAAPAQVNVNVGASPAPPCVAAPAPVAYAPQPQMVYAAPQMYAPQRQAMTVQEEEAYCGPISWVICCFTGCWCIAFCPLDKRMKTTIVR